MTQLNVFKYTQKDFLLFDQLSNVTEVDLIRVVNYKTQFDKLNSDDNDESVLFRVKTSCNNAKSFFTFALNCQDTYEDSSKYLQDVYQLLRLFID